MPQKTKRHSKKNGHGKHGKKVDDCLYKNLDLPAEIALYYGFTPTEAPTISKEDVKKARVLKEHEQKTRDSGEMSLCLPLEQKVALIRLYGDKKMEHLSQPVMLYFGKPIAAGNTDKKNKGKDRVVSLEIMGTPKSIAEALLIKTAIEILKEEGFGSLSVHLNSVGERDTLARFSRELTAYYRKNSEALPSHCRQLLKKEVFDLLACTNEKCRTLKEGAPKSMSFLSEQSRQHFKEVLEYLEILEIPYEIDHCLMGSRSFSCQTLFEIHDLKKSSASQPLAVGIRYASVAKKLGLRRDLPGVGVQLTFKETREHERKNLKFNKPKIYFIQLGFEAKLKSLKIIEILRKNKIPMHHGVSRDKLISQFSVAENMKIPYTIIMGQKEALDDTVIVRTMWNRSQETIKISELPKYLKKL